MTGLAPNEPKIDCGIASLNTTLIVGKYVFSKGINVRISQQDGKLGGQEDFFAFCNIRANAKGYRSDSVGGENARKGAPCGLT